MFTVDPNNLLDNRLDTPTVTYTAGAQLNFRQNYDIEQSSATLAFDAGVLEISINGGAFQDIITAGGSFVTGAREFPCIVSPHISEAEILTLLASLLRIEPSILTMSKIARKFLTF